MSTCSYIVIGSLIDLKYHRLLDLRVSTSEEERLYLDYRGNGGRS